MNSNPCRWLGRTCEQDYRILFHRFPTRSLHILNCTVYSLWSLVILFPFVLWSNTGYCTIYNSTCSMCSIYASLSTTVLAAGFEGTISLLFEPCFSFIQERWGKTEFEWVPYKESAKLAFLSSHWMFSFPSRRSIKLRVWAVAAVAGPNSKFYSY